MEIIAQNGQAKTDSSQTRPKALRLQQWEEKNARSLKNNVHGLAFCPRDENYEI